MIDSLWRCDGKRTARVGLAREDDAVVVVFRRVAKERIRCIKRLDEREEVSLQLGPRGAEPPGGGGGVGDRGEACEEVNLSDSVYVPQPAVSHITCAHGLVHPHNVGHLAPPGVGHDQRFVRAADERHRPVL